MYEQYFHSCIVFRKDLFSCGKGDTAHASRRASDCAAMVTARRDIFGPPGGAGGSLLKNVGINVK